MMQSFVRSLFLAAACAACFLATSVSGARAQRASVSGLLDFALAPADTAVLLNRWNAGVTSFDPYRLRLFFDGQASDAVALHAQIFANDETDIFVYGAYATISPWSERDLHFEAGKIPWPIGTFGPRTYSNENPLMGSPLIYQYHTTVRSDQLATSVDELLSMSGQGQFGVRYTGGSNTRRGLPIVYDSCWDAGAVFLGSMRPFEFSAGMTNGTPSAPRAGRDDNSGKSVMGRVGFLPHPSIRVGVSGSIGPYVSEDVEPDLPAGKSAEDYDQQLVMADLQWQFDHVELHAEGLVNTWQTPYAGDLTVRGYYVEGKYTFPVGLFLAGRWEELRFSDVRDSTGTLRTWDDDVRRVEVGAGFRVQRRVFAKLLYQRHWLTPSLAALEERSYDLVAGQLSVGF